MTTQEYIEKLRMALSQAKTDIWHVYRCKPERKHSAVEAGSGMIDAALVLAPLDDGPKPWPPPEEMNEVLGYETLFEAWMRVVKLPEMKWSDCFVEPYSYTHYLPMPPAPGGGK